MRRAALLASLMLGACSAQDGLHEALYRMGNPDGAKVGTGSTAVLPPWKVHSPQSCAKLTTPGAVLGARDNYSQLVELCRKDDRDILVASR